MDKKKCTYTNKHTEFVSFLRNTMVPSGVEDDSTNIQNNNDTDNEVDKGLMLELERLFDNLFDSLD